VSIKKYWLPWPEAVIPFPYIYSAFIVLVGSCFLKVLFSRTTTMQTRKKIRIKSSILIDPGFIC